MEAGPSSSSAAASTSAAPFLVGTASVTHGAASPTPSNLLYSDDGQLAIVTRAELHLLTPALGYASKQITGGSGGAVRLAGAKKATDSLEADKGKGKERDELPWLKTAILLDKKHTIRWADWADEYDLNMPGLVEPHWRTACWSPSGLSHLGGCLLAALTTNGEVLVLAPKKNAVMGEWEEIYDLTSTLIRQLAPDQSNQDTQSAGMRREMVAALLRCQTTAIAWSPPVPGSACDLSLLALGHRSGEVSLWRLGASDAPEYLTHFSLDAEVNIVNVLAWSEWQATSDTSVSSHLAIADGDGRVFSVEIKQERPATGAAAAPAPAIMSASEVRAADRRGATQMCWVTRDDETATELRLAFSKLGTVSLASCARRSGEAGVREWQVEEVDLPLVGQERWMGSNPWAPCSGLAYLPESDSLLVSLSSAAFYVFKLSPRLELEPESARAASSLTLSARELFEEVITRMSAKGKGRPAGQPQQQADGGATKPRIGRKEGARVMGLTRLNKGSGEATGRLGDVAFIFETARPDSSIHRTWGQYRTFLAVAELSGAGSSAKTALEERAEIEHALSWPTNPRFQSSLRKLAFPLYHLRRHSSDPDFVQPLLEVLAAPPVPRDDAEMSSCSEGLASSLKTQMYADSELESTREKETLARTLLLDSELAPAVRERTQQVHRDLLHVLTAAVLKKLASVLGELDLQEPATAIRARVELASKSLAAPTDAGVGSHGSPAGALRQAFEQQGVVCPACRAPVPLANVRHACCTSGHQWERCSVTLDLISTVQVRTCTACERKALLHAEDPQLAQLLRSVTCCLYCGGRWMRIR
ncbi:hypothetical protein JCM8202_000355 [Rhodotorula sphaerocarpa]